jgi:hypothetical protein
LPTTNDVTLNKAIYFNYAPNFNDAQLTLFNLKVFVPFFFLFWEKILPMIKTNEMQRMIDGQEEYLNVSLDF